MSVEALAMVESPKNFRAPLRGGGGKEDKR
jgi:hypothetical protein